MQGLGHIRSFFDRSSRQFASISASFQDHLTFRMGLLGIITAAFMWKGAAEMQEIGLPAPWLFLAIASLSLIRLSLRLSGTVLPPAADAALVIALFVGSWVILFLGWHTFSAALSRGLAQGLLLAPHLYLAAASIAAGILSHHATVLALEIFGGSLDVWSRIGRWAAACGAVASALVVFFSAKADPSAVGWMVALTGALSLLFLASLPSLRRMLPDAVNPAVGPATGVVLLAAAVLLVVLAAGPVALLLAWIAALGFVFVALDRCLWPTPHEGASQTARAYEAFTAGR